MGYRDKHTPPAKYTYATSEEVANRDNVGQQSAPTSGNVIPFTDNSGTSMADPPIKHVSGDMKFSSGGP